MEKCSLSRGEEFIFLGEVLAQGKVVCAKGEVFRCHRIKVFLRRGRTNGVGPSTTSAWPGRKQPDISMEVDTVRLETSRLETGVLKELSLAGIAKLSQLKCS
jgi:hypothetical protein